MNECRCSRCGRPAGSFTQNLIDAYCERDRLQLELAVSKEEIRQLKMSIGVFEMKEKVKGL
jgi:hypothetical protein